jgi:hypothetical protein
MYLQPMPHPSALSHVSIAPCFFLGVRRPLANPEGIAKRSTNPVNERRRGNFNGRCWQTANQSN